MLRTHVDEPLVVRLTNRIRDRRVGLHVQGRGLGRPGAAGVRNGDGAHVGNNPDTTAGFRETVTYRWACRDEGAWPMNDLADVRGTEEGGNVHGLFGALVVGHPGTTYHDPEDGRELTGEDRAAVGSTSTSTCPVTPERSPTRRAATSTCTATRRSTRPGCAATASSRSSSTTSRRSTAGTTPPASTP